MILPSVTNDPLQWLMIPPSVTKAPTLSDYPPFLPPVMIPPSVTTPHSHWWSHPQWLPPTPIDDPTLSDYPPLPPLVMIPPSVTTPHSHPQWWSHPQWLPPTPTPSDGPTRSDYPPTPIPSDDPTLNNCGSHSQWLMIPSSMTNVTLSDWGSNPVTDDPIHSLK